MSLKLKREHLERIVYEELQRFIAEQVSLNEAPPGRETVLDTEEDPADAIPSPEDAPEESLPTTSPADEVGDDVGEEPEELPTGEEPADDELADDLAGADTGAEPGTVAAELEGKTIEAISLEEDSKMMPGSTEVVITFRESPDALRLLIGKSGKFKIFYKGLHNSFASPVEQIPGDEAPEDELGPDAELDDMDPEADDTEPEEYEDMPPLGDDDMPEDPESV